MQFPTLSTNAVMQYPAPLAVSSPAQVIRFIDGSDQRFLVRGPILRTWLVNLRNLNENELAQVEQFFRSNGGEYSAFSFPDPFTGNAVPNCRLTRPDLTTEYLATDIGATSLLVVETHA